ncbi:MAG: LysR family transcriptional regulator [Vicinamibacterales bacterium]
MGRILAAAQLLLKCIVLIVGMHAVNIARLDLNLLVVFDALMHERNVTRAARRLFLSQPAVSHALNRLRSSLGDPLFVRNGRDMTPTARAESLIPVVRPLLEGLNEALLGSSFSPARLDQTFRLALPDVAEWVVVPRLLPRLAREAPLVRLALHEIDLDDFQDETARGELDAVIVADVPLRPGMHKRLIVREDRVVGVVRRGHPAAGRVLAPEELRRMPRLAVTLSGGRIASPIEQSALARKHLGEVRVSTAHINSTAATLRHSDLILVIGELAGVTLAEFFGLEILPLPVRLPPVESVLVWHERTHRDPAQRWFREAILASLDSLGEAAPKRRRPGASARR